ncbi:MULTISPECIES: efflux RND transporter periplasmic adaptor subunit [Butyricimonas]|uniref:efflux RND transporter periplasmic adaptor subunit n=1 Tax=Butyricimonas TaxID=574697 RepID=UPI000380A4A0|nr:MULTISPECIES: efflux RND transporter periplasmic adaptor subunit [Butyricimonas]
MRFRTVVLSACLALLTACGNERPAPGRERVYPVFKVTTTSVDIVESYSATIEGCQDVEIYPQVSGTISSLMVKEGEKVKRGQSLFVIDQVSYRAALRTATASVHVAEAQVETAKLEYDSKRILFDEKVISEYDLSMAKNALTIAEANLEQARARETNAKNDLSYTEVHSPVDGVVGTLPFRAGALVGPSISKPLTTVSDTRQMYVYFSMSENQIRNLIRQYGSPDEMIRKMPDVELRLNDGSIYESKGRIETISGIINSQTGTASVRCVFPNEKRLLFSGGVGSVILPHEERGVIVIPQGTTYEIQDKIYVYKVVDGMAKSTEISVDKLNNGKTYLVRGGLQEGDVLVREGVAMLKDGAPVSIKND